MSATCVQCDTFCCERGKLHVKRLRVLAIRAPATAMLPLPLALSALPLCRMSYRGGASMSLCRCCQACICGAAAAARLCAVADAIAIMRAQANTDNALGLLAALTPMALPLSRRTACFYPETPSLKSLRKGPSSRKFLGIFRAVWSPLWLVSTQSLIVHAATNRRQCRRAAVRRAVDDEVPSAVEEKTGPAAVRRMPPGLLDALPIHALGAHSA